jgi:hypothetical protein
MEAEVHAEEKVLFPACDSYLPKTIFDLLNDVWDDIIVHMRDFGVVHIPCFRALFSVGCLICNAGVVWI